MSDLVAFRHISAVVETANFTRAAERLFLAQPSLSKQIKDLEDELGFPIFVRIPEGVGVTDPDQRSSLRPRGFECAPPNDCDGASGS
jgi:Bacterial regulatory helix-turn-helix protein, lysR family